MTDIVTAPDMTEKLSQLEECLSAKGMLRYKPNAAKAKEPEEERETLAQSVILKEMEDEQYRFDCLNVNIGVIGATRRVGTTTVAIGLANFIQNHGGTACYVALNLNRHLDSIANMYHFDTEDDDANGNITQITDAEGYTTSYVYDLLDRLISITDAEGNTVTNTYDANGNLVSITDARGNTATFVYDALDRPTQVIDPAGGVVTSEYDSDGREIKVIDQEGAETSYEYDLNDRVVKMTDALGNETRFEYDSMDRVIRTIDAKDAVTSYTYTKTGLVETITDALGGVTRHTYDALGRLIAEMNQNGETTRYTYDALGRVLSVSDPLGNTESLTYDALGRIVAVTDQKGVVKRYGYDPNGNVISSTDASGITSYFEYDKMNRLVKLIVNGKDSHVTLYEYDGRGLVTRTVNALGDDKVFVYDQNGNLISETDEDGNVTTFTYGARDLVESINYAGGKSVTYRYDKTGNLVQMDDWTGQTSFTRDLLGRITQVNDQNSRVTGYEYDAVGNQSKIDYPDGSSVSKTYDELSRLTAVTDADGSITYTYDPAGHVKSMAFPNGISELYDYDLAGRLIEMTQKNPDGTTKMLNRFTYDPVGNVIKSEGVGYGEVRVETINSTYNELNQLMTRKVWSAVGRLINDITYTYDKRGNLIEANDVREDRITTYTYDETNKMVRGVNGDGEVSTYTYNGLGILVGHSETTYRGTVVTDYVVDYTSAVQNNLMAYGSDDFIYRYAYGTGLSKISVKVTTPSDVMKLYIQSDRLGSGRYATDATGVQVAYSFVDVWGLPVDFRKVYVGSTSLKILDNFTNHDYDEILGIYYAKARFYDPVTMRFMAMDPARDGLNWYVYAENNPVSRFDPLGLYGIGDWWRDWKAGVEIIAADPRDAWNTLTNEVFTAESYYDGIEILQNSGTAGRNFAAYSLGVTDALGATWDGLVNFVQHPIQTTVDTITALPSIPGQIWNWLTCVGNNIAAGDWESLSYQAGGLSVVVVEAYVGGKVTKGVKSVGSKAWNGIKNAWSDAGAILSDNGGYVKLPGAGNGTYITNDVLEASRAGSALKIDPYHAFNDIVDNYAGMATKTPISNGVLYQLEGSLNGVQGRFEWIIDNTGRFAGQVSHRYFVSGGTLNGVPIKP